MRNFLAVIGVIVICAIGFVAFKMLQPVPEELDLATTRMTDGQHFSVSIAPENPEYRRNDLHVWIATITTAEGVPVDDATLLVDGGMPQHGHGLPTAPEMTEGLGDGRYKIEGVRLNMGGWWEFKLSITAGEVSDVITFNLVF